MAVEGVGQGGGFQAASVKPARPPVEKQKLAPEPKPDLAAKPQPPLSPTSVDVKV